MMIVMEEKVGNDVLALKVPAQWSFQRVKRYTSTLMEKKKCSTSVPGTRE